MAIVAPPGSSTQVIDLVRQLNAEFNRLVENPASPRRLPTFTASTLPAATGFVNSLALLDTGEVVASNKTQWLLNYVATPKATSRDGLVALIARGAERDMYVPAGTYPLTSTVTIPNGDAHMVVDVHADFTGSLFDMDGLIPRQTNPLFTLDGTVKTYGPDHAGYLNIYQFAHSAIIADGGPARVVALYGFGESKVSGKCAWGSNIVAIASEPGALAIGLELDVGVTAAGGLGYGIAVAATGSHPVEFAYSIQGNNPGATFKDGILFDNSPVQIVTETLIKSTGTQAQRGIYFTGSFSSAEYEGPSFRVGSTPANINSQVEILGSAVGQTQIRARGTGATPAADIDLLFRPAGAGEIQLRSSDNAPKVRLSNVGVAFQGTAPIAKPTLPAALPMDGSATSAQLAVAFNNARAALVAYGLCT